MASARRQPRASFGKRGQSYIRVYITQGVSKETSSALRLASTTAFMQRHLSFLARQHGSDIFLQYVEDDRFCSAKKMEYNYGMTQLIQAIYENGVFRPLAPVQITENEQVSLVIESSAKEPEADVIARQHDALAKLRAEMDAIPDTAPVDGFGGADHDAILYGGRDGIC
jgi:predicted DNA-binding antitoxin AbrB/MazE fold protein